MYLSVNNQSVEVLAEELAAYTGESVSNALEVALRERLQRVKEERSTPLHRREILLRIGEECAALPVIDNRTADEILSYDELELPA